MELNCKKLSIEEDTCLQNESSDNSEELNRHMWFVKLDGKERSSNKGA